MYNPYLKRILDFCIALLSLIVLSPLIVVLIFLLFIANEGQPFFVQARPGKKGHIFNIIKFKTMKDLDEASLADIHSQKRVTKVGGFIRKYSLDEILQLVNVLKGDMSLIGPRPLLMDYLPLYNRVQRQRHDVRPGITGWAQINGRNALSWDEKFKFDVWYLENISFLLDMKILFGTFLKVFNKEGINKGEETIMPVWEGN